MPFTSHAQQKMMARRGACDCSRTVGPFICAAVLAVLPVMSALGKRAIIYVHAHLTTCDSLLSYVVTICAGLPVGVRGR